MKYFLKKNVYIAPYIWDWYAWSHLIPPHTASANIVERHCAIMQSFLEDPELHQEAIHSRKLIGGPFINLPPHQAPLIKDLLTVTYSHCRDLIKLHLDIKEFSLYLYANAQGQSLDSFYKLLPNSLKGTVELLYDLNNSPTIRFIEPILYHRFNSKPYQSLCIAETLDDERPFSFSTPFISHDKVLQKYMPFDSTRIDDLVALKKAPKPFDQIMEIIEPSSNEIDLVKTLLSPETWANNDVPHLGDGVRVRYFGHACVLLSSKMANILIDPVFGYPTAPNQRDRMSIHDLPEHIDYVLITHNHQDHFLFETLIQLRTQIGTMVVPAANGGSIVDPSLKLILKEIGINNVISMNEFEQISLSNSSFIQCLPFLGEHGDLAIQTKTSYYVHLQGHKFLFLADSNNLDPNLYAYIYDIIGEVTTIFIGMECVGAPASWLYGPLMPKKLAREHDQSRRLSGSDANKAWEIIQIFKCRELYVYAMGMEPWLNYIMAIDYHSTSKPIVQSDALIQRCLEQGIKSERLFLNKEWIY